MREEFVLLADCRRDAADGGGGVEGVMKILFCRCRQKDPGTNKNLGGGAGGPFYIQ